MDNPYSTNQVQDILTELEITQSTLSKISGVQKDIISKIIHNPKYDPRRSTMVKIARALGKPLDEVWGWH